MPEELRPRSRQDLPRRRDLKAKAAPSWRFWGLEVPVGTMETRQEASRVAQANHGAPGIDGVTCEEVEASGVEPLLEHRRDAVVARTYHPRRVRRKAIPQDGGTKVRVLGMPTSRDRGVQGALTLILEPMVEADCPPGSSGYRPQRSAHAAVERVAEAMVRWKTRGIAGDRHGDCDNRCPHVLLATVATRLNEAAVRHLFKGIVKASGRKGVPQGGVISPWLSPLYLTEVARRLERAKEVTRSGTYPSIASARCADARVIVVEAHRRHDGRLQAVEPRLREAWAVLHVTIQEEKSRRVDRARGATFSVLGVDVRRVQSRRGGWRPWSTPMRQKRTARLRKGKERCRRYASQPVDRVLDLLNPILRGGVRSFAVGDAHRGVGGIKDWVEKQVRRHRRRARNRKGVGWKRGRRRGRYDTLRLFHTDRVSRPQPQALPVREVP